MIRTGRELALEVAWAIATGVALAADHVAQRAQRRLHRLRLG